VLHAKRIKWEDTGGKFGENRSKTENHAFENCGDPVAIGLRVSWTD
jgi:hypothetical protein